MLSQLAFRLGKSLTAGRKSAPATHKEAQNQLFALSQALRSITIEEDAESLQRSGVSQERNDGPSQDVKGLHDEEQSKNLEAMIGNFEDVLERLRALIENYTTMGQNLGEEDSNSKKKWRQELRDNWKKVRWTMKDDDVEKLRKDLAIHIQSLNLAISGFSNSRTKRIESKVSDVHEMLSDVHSWFSENLQSKKLTVSTQECGPSNISTDAITDESALTFELYADLPTGLGPTLLCPTVSFGAGWLRSRPGSRSQRLFLCRCSEQFASRTLSNDRVDEDHRKQLQFSLLSISLIVHLVGERAWQLFSRSSKVTSLIIRGIKPSDFALFQRCVDQLALVQAQTSLSKGGGSMLMHYSGAEGGEKRVSILDAKVETSNFHGQISTITFIANGRRFTQSSIDSVQILHYRSASLPRFNSLALLETRTALHEKHGELIFRPLSKSSSGPRLVVNVFYDTKVQHSQGTRTLHIFDVSCANEDPNRKPIRTACEIVEVEFVAERAARQFLASVKAMQEELHMYYLQFPQSGERILYERFCGDMMIRDRYLVDAKMTILVNPSNNMHRMIVLSGSNDACVSMELPLAFFQSLVTDDSMGKDTIWVSAHFVEHLPDSASITVLPTDIPLVALRDVSTSALTLRLR